MAGWIKLHRDILRWEWFTDSHTLQLFIYLIVTANHIDGKWRGIDVKKGQCMTSQDAICRESGLSRQQVRTALDHLTLTGEITIKTTKKYSLVTICNYDRYQADETLEQPSTQPSAQPTTNQQPTNNQPSEQEKEKKNQEKNKETNKNEENERILDKETKSPNGDISEEIPTTLNKTKFDFKTTLIKNFNVPEQWVKDFMAVRQKKKAANTETALKGFIREAQKAGISIAEAVRVSAENSWQGFKAEWYQNLITKQNGIYNRQRQDRRGESPVSDFANAKPEDFQFRV